MLLYGVDPAYGEEMGPWVDMPNNPSFRRVAVGRLHRDEMPGSSWFAAVRAAGPARPRLPPDRLDVKVTRLGVAGK